MHRILEASGAVFGLIVLTVQGRAAATFGPFCIAEKLLKSIPTNMKECSLEALFFAYDHPEDFYKIVCQKTDRPSRLLIVFRVFIVIYSYSVGLWLVCQLFLAPKLKLYNSYCSWVQILWSATADFAFLKSMKTIRIYSAWDFIPGLPWYVKVYWALFSATLPAVVLSFIVFWSQIYHENVDILYIFMGNVTPFLSLLEFALVAFPLRIVNFFYFLLHSLLYVGFTAVYQAAGGLGMDRTRWIYKDLDWSDPKHAGLAAFIALLIGEAAYLIFWAVSKLKLSKWCCGKETE